MRYSDFLPVKFSATYITQKLTFGITFYRDKCLRFHKKVTSFKSMTIRVCKFEIIFVTSFEESHVVEIFLCSTLKTKCNKLFLNLDTLECENYQKPLYLKENICK